MNHKRRRPKNRRAGCLVCKPHKACGSHQPNASTRRRIEAAESTRAQ